VQQLKKDLEMPLDTRKEKPLLPQFSRAEQAFITTGT
jgi:hypothetical protein